MVNRVQVESYEQIISLISYMESELDLIRQLQILLPFLPSWPVCLDLGVYSDD